MTTKINFSSNSWNVFKRMLYALQVIVIAIAIPLLSYMELTHKDKDQNLPGKTISKTVIITTMPVAYNQ